MTITTPGGETTISESYLLVHLYMATPNGVCTWLGRF
jgi:hypothetical protein